MGLNPCCNGIYSMRVDKYYFWGKFGLNPCCNGIYSMSTQGVSQGICPIVLILVVMEYTQWVWFMLKSSNIYVVLILVVMEYTQWATPSRYLKGHYRVLILVVMEYTQWVKYGTFRI